MDYIKSIFLALKEEPGATLKRITRLIGDIDTPELYITIHDLCEKGMIHSENNKYFITHMLDPIRPESPKSKFKLYEKIRIPSKLNTVPLPDAYLCPLWKLVAPRQQGNTGTCVGQHGAYIMDLNYLTLTGQTTYTGEITRDIPIGTTYYDTLYDQSFSAIKIYVDSRREGAVKEPAGSWTWAAMLTMQKNGTCLNNQWVLSKDGKTQWFEPSPATATECTLTADQHKIEGYAKITTKLGLKQALFERGFVSGAIDIYANYMDIGKNTQGLYEGRLPDPRGECVGSHALCFIGYDDLNLYFLHSWADWEVLGSISWNYWERAKGDFFAILDTHESIIGMQSFKTINVTANVVATITVDGTPAGSTPAKLELLNDKPHTITGSANGYKDATITITTTSNQTPNQSYYIMLESIDPIPTPKPNPAPVSEWGAIIDFLIQLLFRK